MKRLSVFSLVAQRRENRRKQLHSLQRQARLFFFGSGALVLLVAASVMLASSFAYAHVFSQLPSVTAIPSLLDMPNGTLLQPTRLFDRTGDHLILELANPGIVRKNLTVSATQTDHFSPNLVQLTLAVLDPQFQQHPGVLLTSLMNDQVNTLAERLVDTFLLDQEPPSFRRSLRLRLLAVQLTSAYGQDRILDWYLNSANYGHLAYGAEAAAQLYLGKSASQLNLAEAALLVAVNQAPALNPLDAPEAAQFAQRQLITQLLEDRQISTTQAEQAINHPIQLLKAPIAVEQPGRAFARLALDQAAAIVGRDRLERGGLRIITTLDYDLQTQVRCAALTELQRLSTPPDTVYVSLSQDCPAANLLPSLPLRQQLPDGEYAASAAILDPLSGQVLALLGDTTLNNGESYIIAEHPAGSLWTPFIYLAAFTRGYGPASLVWDIPASLPPYAINDSNLDGQFHGPQRLRLALANDYLAPAAQLLSQIGPENIWTLLAPFGLPVNSNAGLPFSDGVLNPLQAAQAYGILANEGILVGQVQQNGQALQPALLLEMTGLDGHTWLDWRAANSRPIISAPLAYLMNQALSDEAARWPSLGYPNVLEIGRPAAVKLGQLSDKPDGWTAGYTPQRVTVVWIGIRGQDSTSDALDARLAAGLWNALTKYTHQDLPPTGWTPPPGINRMDVCDPSGLLPTRNCQNIVNEVFLSGNEPVTYDDLYQIFQINRETGHLATVFTPPELIEEHIYMVTPPEARAWASEQNLPTPPTTYDTIQPAASSPFVKITMPELFTTISGKVAIRGSASGENFTSYQVQVGQGLNPQTWFQLSDPANRKIQDGLLVTWDTTLSPDGLYAIRLVVVHNDQQLETAISQVTVDNTPPQLVVLFPENNQSINGTTMTFKAQASDTVALSRIEWWIGDHLAGTVMKPPYHLIWQGTTGKFTLVVRAFDAVGNQTASSPITFTLNK